MAQLQPIHPVAETRTKPLLLTMKDVAKETGLPLSSIKGRRGNTEWLWAIARNVSRSREKAVWRWSTEEVLAAFRALPAAGERTTPKRLVKKSVSVAEIMTSDRYKQLCEEFGVPAQQELGSVSHDAKRQKEKRRNDSSIAPQTRHRSLKG